MKKIFLIALLCAGAYAIQPFTYFWTVTPTNSQMTTQKLRANYDSILFWTGKACDTMNKSFLRRGWIKDSVFDSINVRKLKRCDSIYTRVIKATVIDSVNTFKRLRGTNATFSDSVVCRVIKAGLFDSVNTSKTLVGVKGRFSDSLISTNAKSTNLNSTNATIATATISSLTIGTTLTNTQSSNLDTIRNKYAQGENLRYYKGDIDSVVSIYLGAQSTQTNSLNAINVRCDNVYAKKVVDSSSEYGSTIVSYVGFTTSPVYDTMRYLRRVVSTDTIIDLWFKNTVVGASNVVGLTNVGGGIVLEAKLRPTYTVEAKTRVMSSGVANTGVCIIGSTGSFDFYVDTVVSGKINYLAPSATGNKGFFPFHISYIRK